jgi:hypothetical protein
MRVNDLSAVICGNRGVRLVSHSMRLWFDGQRRLANRFREGGARMSMKLDRAGDDFAGQILATRGFSQGSSHDRRLPVWLNRLAHRRD